MRLGVVSLVAAMVCVACTCRGCACCDERKDPSPPEGTKSGVPSGGTRTRVAGQRYEVVPRPPRDYTPGPRRYENAIHVRFDGVPRALFEASQTRWSPNDTCRVSGSVFRQSHDEALRLMSRFVGDAGSLEPSYGCRVTTPMFPGHAVGPRERGPESLRNFWTLRPGQALQDAQLVAVSERLSGFSGVHAAPVPLVRPATFDPEQEPLLGEDHISANTEEGTQWYQFETNVVEAWSKVGPMDRERGPVVAVIDMGFRTTHTELKNVIEPMSPYNACYGDRKVDRGETDIWHGTAVAGILAATCDGEGIVGVAPDVRVWPIQGPCQGERDQSGRPVQVGDSWGKAIQHVLDHRRRGEPTIILLAVETASGKNIEGHQVIHDAIARAVHDYGFVVVVAAGNGKTDAGTDDAGKTIEETDSILVGATTYQSDSTRADFSNHGLRVKVYAPGDVNRDLTISAASDGAYIASLGGTSGAAPKVAGVVAMMLSKNPQLTPDAIKQILASNGGSVVDNGANDKGMFLDAVKAVEAATAGAH